MTYDWIQPLGPKVIGVIGDLLPWFKDMFAELTAFFEKLSHELPPVK
jgi:membrane protein required for colicin V production